MIANSPGNTFHELQLGITVNNDLDIPIALRKGVRLCTQHSIYNFVSYDGLSPKYQAFVANLSNVKIPEY